MAKKKKAVKLDRADARRQFLALKPARNPALGWEEVEGRVVLTIPRPNNLKVKIINIFFPVPDDRKVVLDPIGTHVWRQCDGLTTIEKIGRSLQSEYKLGAKEAELSLRQFFQDLGKRGYIGFAVEKKKPEARVE
jgi:hypothetical protein